MAGVAGFMPKRFVRRVDHSVFGKRLVSALAWPWGAHLKMAVT